MGVHTNVSDTAPVNVIPLIAHCRDMASISPNDSQENRDSKLFTTKLAKEWLGFED